MEQKEFLEMFKELKGKRAEDLVNQSRSIGYADIENAYEKPSCAKYRIWNYYYLAIKTIFSNATIWISSKNTFSFCIMFETETFVGKITPTNKYIAMKD